ncbi:MAG: hypothetical protein COX06_00575 [Candidatus Zambryskibacteria bacterium CG22_combo_CG10-13_8_21_14_all_42_17]|uniref:Uncharacterized protein n=1 Tax=Candidatus Zambryskibacteria bacterium CG22_combo_CG10-13_8_21_14_all_42_17 TaxID=1975118 RepID=A0A2H0BED3_9BACT|nr:MAG: hypothetical protein COX06_00575 [Candidatus Zambryskibacteria bacterium CG22_combo_CG10-13_8_21_14_all_42_17]
MTRRLLWSVIIFISIMVLPFWIYIPVLFAVIVFVPFFWEGILFTFLIEVVHNSGIEFFSLLSSPLVISVLVALIILLPIRDRIRTYA